MRDKIIFSFFILEPKLKLFSKKKKEIICGFHLIQVALI